MEMKGGRGKRRKKRGIWSDIIVPLCLLTASSTYIARGAQVQARQQTVAGDWKKAQRRETTRCCIMISQMTVAVA